MKKIIVMLALCVGTSAAVQAQDVKGERGMHKNMTVEQRAEKQTVRMEQALQLNETQKKAIYELNLQAAKEMQATKAATREANREKFKAIHQAKDEKMKSILTADQYGKYETIKAERKKRMQEKRSSKGLQKG